MYKLRPTNAIDFYKTGHGPQYPDGTTLVYANFTPRSARLANMSDFFDNRIVVFGIQAFCKAFLIDTWNNEFFNKPKDEVIGYYERRLNTSIGENKAMVDAMAALHDLQRLPIELKALPEGSLCPIGVPVLTIKNTVPEFFWLTNYLESVLSACLWKFMTSATTAFEYRKIIEKWCNKTGGSKEFVGFQGHDFSFRGMSGLEDAVMSGSAHLLSFPSTDSVLAIDFLEDYYNADAEKELIGGSVPATEHSVMCMGGVEDEIGTFRRLINELYPEGIVSVVSDTWDFWKVITEYMPVLKNEIMQRDGKLVIRPDSGDPVRIICGYERHEYYVGVDGKFHKNETEEILSLEEIKGAIECLWNTFGGTKTTEGYKTLDSHIGLIYGDAITLDRAEEILKRLAKKGFSSDNVVFGIGSYTYEYVTRDTFGFAMKATYGEVNGEGKDIFKDPKTDTGVKKSAKGLLSVSSSYDGSDTGLYVLNQGVTPKQERAGCLRTIFVDSHLIIDESLDCIRDRLKSYRLT